VERKKCFIHVFLAISIPGLIFLCLIMDDIILEVKEDKTELNEDIARIVYHTYDIFIVISYIVIYSKIKIKYAQIIENQKNHQGLEKKMNEDLKALKLVYISISVLCIVRII